MTGAPTATYSVCQALFMGEVSSFSDVDRSPDPVACALRLDNLAIDLADAKVRPNRLLGQLNVQLTRYYATGVAS